MSSAAIAESARLGPHSGYRRKQGLKASFCNAVLGRKQRRGAGNDRGLYLNIRKSNGRLEDGRIFEK